MYFNKSLYALFPTWPYKFNSDAREFYYKLIFEDLRGVNSLLANTNTLATLDDPSVGYTNTFASLTEIDPQTLKCSITADKQFFVNRCNGKDFVDNPNISMCVSKSLYALFPTLPYNFNSATGD